MAVYKRPMERTHSKSNGEETSREGNGGTTTEGEKGKEKPSDLALFLSGAAEVAYARAKCHLDGIFVLADLIVRPKHFPTLFSTTSPVALSRRNTAANMFKPSSPLFGGLLWYVSPCC